MVQPLFAPPWRSGFTRAKEDQFLIGTFCQFCLNFHEDLSYYPNGLPMDYPWIKHEKVNMALNTVQILSTLKSDTP